MKFNSLYPICMAAALALTTSCDNNGGDSSDEKIIEKPAFTAPEDGAFSIDALESLGTVSEPQVSPDGKTLLFALSYESVEENRGNKELYTLDLTNAEAKPVRLTTTAASEGNARWFDGGNKIAFTYPVKNSDGEKVVQVWVMNADGSGRKAVSNFEKNVEGFVISPDGENILVISTVKFAKSAGDIYPDLPKATGRVIDDLMYKHWDEWVTDIPHPFIAAFHNGEGELTDVKDIMADEPRFECPMRPWGGVEAFAWSPDSKSLVYVSRKKAGKEYSLSTNSDLYLYTLADGSTRNLTEGMMGYDTNPAFSPDGQYLAWLSMEHDGYESDKNRIFLMNMASGEKTDLTADWDYHVDDFAWAPGGKSLFFIAPKDGTQPMFKMDIATKAVTVVNDDVCDYKSIVPLSDTSVITMRHSLIRANELWLLAENEAKALTDINGDIFGALKMPTVRKRMVPTTDGKLMTTWVVYPQDFDSTKTYPAILYCQGGPQSPVSQFWSTRWNLCLMAAKGYIVIAPNRRGLPGFGTEWNAQISGDYPGQNMRDYLAAVDDMKKEPYIDAAHIGAVGASYGGYSVYWLAGNHEGRFAAFIAHAGIFNTESQYLETEEMWFENWDTGGSFWDKSNATAMRTHALSPHRFVDRWDTPILVTHGELDFRILASQGMMAFNAAVLRGIPAKMVIYPDENHWILKPQNGVLWQRVFFEWLDQWLKPTAAASAAAADTTTK